MHYAIRGRHVISQTIDDEVVVIDLSTGNYYSLRGSGVPIWQAILEGKHVDEIQSALTTRYDADDDRIRAALTGLLDTLVEEGLVAGSDAGSNVPAVPPVGNGHKSDFQEPLFERFEDMQDLILLDPVHEVDAEEGWPHRPTEAGSAPNS